MSALRPLLCRLLALLLLVNGAVVAAEVAAHGLCDHGHGESGAMHLHSDVPGHDPIPAASDGRDADGDHDHLCHTHPPLCAAADLSLPPEDTPPPAGFDAIAESFLGRRPSPPVPPPNV